MCVAIQLFASSYEGNEHCCSRLATLFFWRHVLNAIRIGNTMEEKVKRNKQEIFFVLSQQQLQF